jgi:hypothetical protein
MVVCLVMCVARAVLLRCCPAGLLCYLASAPATVHVVLVPISAVAAVDNDLTTTLEGPDEDEDDPWLLVNIGESTHNNLYETAQQHGATQCSIAQHVAAHHQSPQRSTATAQHSTVQHSTAQRTTA